jgi:hypothetical protein
MKIFNLQALPGDELNLKNVMNGEYIRIWKGLLAYFTAFS